MRGLEVTYFRGASGWEIKADIAKDWRMGPKTYCFSEDNRELELSGMKLRFRVSVFPRPNSSRYEESRFPPVKYSAADDSITCEISGTRLTLHILALDAVGKPNLNLPWSLTENRKLCLKWARYPVAKKGTFNYELQLLVVLTFPPPPPVRDLREWGPSNWISSHFESNRSKH